MMHSIAAAALALMLAACAHSPRPPSDSPYTAEERQELEAAADALEAMADSLDAGEPAVGWTTDPELATPEAVLLDPPRDAANPARNRQLVIPSGPVRPELGRPAEMNALFLLAAGDGLKPTLLLLHGLPGNERNLDLAQAVRRAGWNVLTFTYRGAWGSEGSFSIQHAIEDAAAALAFLRSLEALREYRVNPNRIVLAGHSMGGLAALLTAARDPYSGPEKCGRYHWGPEPIAGLILLDAWNAGATALQVRTAGEPGRAAFIAGLDDLGHALGPITAADLADELVRRGEQWELNALARNFAGPCGDGSVGMPVLSIRAAHGLADQNRALAAAFEERPGRRVHAVELDSDHAFADHRIALATEVVRWLQALAPRTRR